MIEAIAILYLVVGAAIYLLMLTSEPLGDSMRSTWRRSRGLFWITLIQFSLYVIVLWPLAFWQSVRRGSAS